MGKFSGYPLTRWKDHRIMILEEPFSFTDDDGKEWIVPKYAELNGATIPRPFWTMVGAPFVGAYRMSSIVHDYYVGEGINPDVSPAARKRADKMFYQACRTEGCSPRFAAFLYAGVRTGSWSAVFFTPQTTGYKTLALENDDLLANKIRALDEDDFDALEQLIDEYNNSL